MTHHDPASLELEQRARANLAVPALYEAAILRQEGVVSAGGPLVVQTGKHTVRSPKDRFIVEESSSAARIAWGDMNTAFSEERYEALRARVMEHLRDRDVFVQDCFVGADPEHRRPLRVFTESAWQSLFAKQLFIRPTQPELEHFTPAFTVYDAASFPADPARDGTRSERFVLIHLGRREILIGGTAYAGEIKKSVFTLMGFLVPEERVLPMHCAANVGHRGDVAIFLGLSGTGKTSLSTDPERVLIGDDEHGWSDNGIFNFEGGCYAKLIHLSPTAEPDIYDTTRRFGAVLENVVIDPQTREVDLDSDAITDNTRGSYPLDFVRAASATGQAGHPSNVVFLTTDAFGVLPPISRLTSDQAMYHFISGYTAMVPGPGTGMTEPMATFSACFGAPFMPRHPGEYAKMMGERIAKHHVSVWLINTGWTGGPFGVGSRIKIGYTRAMVHAALDGTLSGVPTAVDPVFGVAVPEACPGVPADLLVARNTWASKPTYDAQARKLARLFAQNFDAYAAGVSPQVRGAGPRTER